jgi:hypothetical protein
MEKKKYSSHFVREVKKCKEKLEECHSYLEWKSSLLNFGKTSALTRKPRETRRLLTKKDKTVLMYRQRMRGRRERVRTGSRVCMMETHAQTEHNEM